MKKIFIALSILLYGCCDFELTDTQVIQGVVSAKEPGFKGRSSRLPVIYVQSPKKVEEVSIPFSYENNFNVGDTVCLVIKTVKER